jgi:hypothetical protein
VCRRLPDRTSSLVKSCNARPSPCAGVCCRLPLFVAPKGQEKGNIKTARRLRQLNAIMPKQCARGPDRAGAQSATIVDARVTAWLTEDSVARIWSVRAVSIRPLRNRRVLGHGRYGRSLPCARSPTTPRRGAENPARPAGRRQRFVEEAQAAGAPRSPYRSASWLESPRDGEHCASMKRRLTGETRTETFER